VAKSYERKHPAEVLSDRLVYAATRWRLDFTESEHQMIRLLRARLERIAEKSRAPRGPE
jgi:hypothetical protein